MSITYSPSTRESLASVMRPPRVTYCGHTPPIFQSNSCSPSLTQWTSLRLVAKSVAEEPQLAMPISFAW